MSDMVAGTGTLRAGVAEEVRALLGRRRMSSVALARGIGKSHTYVWRRLSGETAFDLDDLAAIAGALDVSVISLLPAAERQREITGGSHVRPRSARPRDGRPGGRTDHSAPTRPAFLRSIGSVTNVDQRVTDPSRLVQGLPTR